MNLDITTENAEEMYEGLSSVEGNVDFLAEEKLL